ncbi:hypothetical protein F2Q69_00048534 [Brassica cretica]|uniref:Uncharacterized protein n=1 Tax=Brassica cretica TaxID=69181 RepID=A0A8S9Q1C0_BRACR|nr:hypothetical protein F2Q69_00048534 [Brassica cretica]
MNNVMKKLDHLLSIEKNDRFALEFQGESSKVEDVLYEAVGTSATKPDVKVYAGNTSNGKTAVKTATDVKTASTANTTTYIAMGKVYDTKNASQRKFWHVFHQCGVVGHIRPRYLKSLRTKNQMEQAYAMKCHGICVLGDLTTMEMVEWDFILTLEDIDLHISF